jgi:hypothetical protein
LKVDITRTILTAALLASAALWCIGLAANPNGRQRNAAVADLLMDYVPPRAMAGRADAYTAAGAPGGVESRDRVYPPLCYDMMRVFPADLRVGGIVFALVSSAIFVLAFGVLVRSAGASPLRTAALTGAAALSAPLIASAANANMISLAAAGVMLWAAWKDSPSPWRRYAAITALALAAMMKITPGVFALCYLKERRWREFAVFAAVAATAFLVPFAWYGGFDGFLGWLANARENASHYSSKGSWGVVPIDRTIRVLKGMSAYNTFDWSTLGASRAANVAAGFVCLLAAAFGRSDGGGRSAGHDTLLLLCGSILLIPGNMHFYTGLYLFAPFALWMGAQRDTAPAIPLILASVFWFLIIGPFQIPLGPGCLNRPLANLAFIGLLALAAMPRRLRGEE